MCFKNSLVILYLVKLKINDLFWGYYNIFKLMKIDFDFVFC